MNTVESFIKNLSLSVTQWIMLILAGGIGVLLLMLGLQGSKLHRMQIQLLQVHLDAGDEKATNAVKAAKDRFNQAYQSYIKARNKS
jgi:hypothetical protein